MKSCVIAYSGGLDSTLLIKVAYDTLGENALAVTAVSSIYPQREQKDAKCFAQTIGIPHVVFSSEELTIDRFSDNPMDRCYYCKKSLFRKIKQIAMEHHFNAILDGSDYVMLSGETAIGKYPVETVRMMRQIIEFTEKSRFRIAGINPGMTKA